MEPATDVKDVEMLVPEPEEKVIRGPPPKNPAAKFGEKIFNVHGRHSTWLREMRAGLVLFMTSAYILFLNPQILSGGGGIPTGMPRSNIVFATAVSTAVATSVMGFVANYPWIVSVQLGTNTYFVNQVLKPGEVCGAHSVLWGSDESCRYVPCTCSVVNGNQTWTAVGAPQCASSPNACLGSKIPFEQALAATFLEGVVFLLICLTGLRSVFMKWIPNTILMAGASGIGAFIAFVGVKNMGVIVANSWPTLLQLAEYWPYLSDGTLGETGLGFNSCEMYFAGPPYGPVCPWLAVGGLIFTGLLVVWNIPGAFIIGIFFTMFISWGVFPEKIGSGGLVPNQIVGMPQYDQTVFKMDFAWGDNTGTLVGALITFLYLDFIGSSITFQSLGQLQGLINDKGDMPRANIAFLSDAVGSMLGGLLGSSALTTYVESAAAVREGGRTGAAAVFCAMLYIASIFLAPLFSVIPDIATGPVLVLIGVIIFMESIGELNWHDFTDAWPALTTILGMVFTNNIAYGVIGGILVYIVAKLFSFQLFEAQKKMAPYRWFKKMECQGDMFTPIPGWNATEDGKRLPEVSRIEQDVSLMTLVRKMSSSKKMSAPIV